MATPKNSLPALAFGNTRSKIDLDLREMQQTVNHITDWVSEFDALTKKTAFEHRTATYVGEKLRLIAVSSSPTVMRVKDSSCTIAVPINGSYDTWVNGEHHQFSVDQGAMYFPSGKRHTEGDNKSTLLISLDERRISDTVKSILGNRSMPDMELDTARVLNLQVGSVDFQKIFRSLCLLIDQFDGDPTLLKNMGIEDSIYRACAMILKPEIFLRIDAISHQNEDRRIDKLCEWIRANLSTPITLTQLEAVSGLSARLLQYEFKRHYNCTPLQWVREQRLGLAHEIFKAADFNTKISSVAALCGFVNFGDFAKRYARRFGELPSQTLKSALRRF